jgi:hypothetical protein
MDVREATMRDRIAGQLLMEKVVADSAARPPLNTLAKVFGSSPIHRDDRSWHTGAAGERLVAATLGRLPAGWHVFHSIPVGIKDSDVDHIVVGPGGIFVLNSKHHAGKKVWVKGRGLLVEGQKTHYISNSASEAATVTRVLRARLPWIPDTKPVLVIVGAKEIVEKKTPDLVHVDGGRTVARWLRKHRVVLSPDSVAQIAAVVNDPRTWRMTLPVALVDLRRRYAELTHADHIAALIRAGWALLVVVAAAIVCVNIAINVIH